MTWRPTRIALLAAVGAGWSLAPSELRTQASTRRPLPVVIEAAAPDYPRVARGALLSGPVELDVTTDGERVTSVDIVTPRPLLDRAAQEGLRNWVFAPHQPTSFRVTVQYERLRTELVDPASCVTREIPRTITHDLPTRVRVQRSSDFLCDAGEVVRTAITTSTLTGQVVCDCPGRAIVPGADVSVQPRAPPEERRPGIERPFSRIVHVDETGQFRIDDAPAGTYDVQVGSLAFTSRRYEVRVVSDGKPRPPLSLSIAPNPAVVQYLRLHPRETSRVSTRQIPTYPIAALTAGVEGLVVVRVTPGSTPVAVEGHRLLTVAALALAKTWETSSRNDEPFDVRIAYRLTQGDCAGGGPRVVLKLPREIEITAKRVFPCAPRTLRGILRLDGDTP
jgi:TonB family protein